MPCPTRIPRAHKKPVHAENEYIPSDGGHGWAVVFGGALTHFMLVGMARCLGIIYLAMQTKFNTSAQETAWASALFNTTRSLIAPLCTKLVVRFGSRFVTIAGALVLFSGLVVTAFATNIYYVYFSFGILTGSGGAMVFTSCYVCVGHYFDKKKGKAMGFATLGSGLGNVILAPLINLYVLHYGFFGTMLLLGAQQLHHLISAFLYVPLSKLSKLKPEYADVVTEVKGTEDGKSASKVDSTTEFLKEDETLAVSSTEIKTDTSNTERPELQNSQIDVTESPIEVEIAEGKPSKKSLRKRKEESLYCNFTFMLYGLLIMCLQATVPTFLIFLPSLAKEHGASETNAAFALSIMGFADMGGRFISAFIYDIKQLRKNRRFVYCVNTALFAGATGCMAFMPSYITTVIMTAVTGIFEGGAHGQRMTILSEFVPSHQVASAIGMVIFFQGVGNIWGPPVAGALQDAYSTSAYGYLLVGGMYMFFNVLFLLQLVLTRKKAT